MHLIPYPSCDTIVPVDSWTAPVWEAAGRGELVVPQCCECGRFRMQPTPFCPNCNSQAVSWPTLSGRGRLYSYTVLKHPSVEGKGYAPAVVELEDAPGIRLLSNVVEAAADDLSVAMPLVVAFHLLAGGLAFPVFRPARGTEA